MKEVLLTEKEVVFLVLLHFHGTIMEIIFLCYNHVKKEVLAKSSNTVKPIGDTYGPHKSVRYSQLSTI